MNKGYSMSELRVKTMMSLPRSMSQIKTLGFLGDDCTVSVALLRQLPLIVLLLRAAW